MSLYLYTFTIHYKNCYVLASSFERAKEAFLGTKHTIRDYYDWHGTIYSKFLSDVAIATRYKPFFFLGSDSKKNDQWVSLSDMHHHLSICKSIYQPAEANFEWIETNYAHLFYIDARFSL